MYASGEEAMVGDIVQGYAGEGEVLNIVPKVWAVNCHGPMDNSATDGAWNKSSSCSIHSEHTVPHACSTKGGTAFRFKADGIGAPAERFSRVTSRLLHKSRKTVSVAESLHGLSRNDFGLEVSTQRHTQSSITMHKRLIASFRRRES